MLTIAFPTYKRPHRIIDAVNDTLKIDSNDIEVIVCDNNEDYKTRDILSNIKDNPTLYKILLKDPERNIHLISSNLKKLIPEIDS